MVFPSERWSTGNHTYLQRTDGFILTFTARPQTSTAGCLCRSGRPLSNNRSFNRMVPHRFR